VNQRDRDQYRPHCERCGELITDIAWHDVSVFNLNEDYLVGLMHCSMIDCYGPDGSRRTSPAKVTDDPSLKSTA
jgi:hypothetical protein